VDEVEEGYPAAKGEWWGEAGVARKGTAPGRIGEENTGGPGGVLRCAGPGLGLGVPGSGAGEKTRGCGGVKGGAAGNGGDACASCGPGGVSSMSAVLVGIRSAARRSDAEGRGSIRIGREAQVLAEREECDEVGFLIGFARPGVIKRRASTCTSAYYWSEFAGSMCHELSLFPSPLFCRQSAPIDGATLRTAASFLVLLLLPLHTVASLVLLPLH
jgi:hypothetical protein